jgi:predicted nucleic acid-binding protein
VAYLFDTDAISELFKARPSSRYVQWLTSIPQEEQFTSAVVVGELFAGAFRSKAHTRHAKNIRDRVLPLLNIIPYDVRAAEAYGRLRAELEDAGMRLADPDLQTAGTALTHGLTLVTGNVKHYARVPGLAISSALWDSRQP